MKQINLPVIITSLATKVDGSIKVTLETRELPPESSADIFRLRGTEAWAVLAPYEMKEIELPNEKPDPSIGTKTPAQRLRAVIYRIWEQGKSGVDFETYYRTQMERIIDQAKEKLDAT